MYLKKIFIIIICFGYFLSIPANAITESVLDRRAKNLPYEQGQSVHDIVSNLTQELTDDKDKARILASFMAYQFQRNGYAARQSAEAARQNKPADTLPDNHLLKTRIGTAHEFAVLYQKLCQDAGIESIVINGYAGKNIKSPDKNISPEVQVLRTSMQQLTGLKDYRLQHYKSSWNAVKINGSWILVDTYFMINGNATVGKNIKNFSEMERFLKQREHQGVKLRELTQGKTIDMNYFDAKPRQFIKTHYPLDSQWQLLPLPVSWHSFLN